MRHNDPNTVPQHVNQNSFRFDPDSCDFAIYDPAFLFVLHKTVIEDFTTVLFLLDQIKQIIDGTSDFSVLSGDDALTYDVMCAGGHGVFSVVSNCMPKQVSEMVDCLAEGNRNRAKEIHDELMPMFKGVFVESNPIPIKYIMAKMGFGTDTLRLPLTPLSQKSVAFIDELMEKYGL